MENINIIDFIFNIFNAIIDGAKSVYNILNYEIPLGGLVKFVSKVFNFFGASIDLTAYNDLSINIFTVGGVDLGLIIIIWLIKKIIPLL